MPLNMSVTEVQGSYRSRDKHVLCNGGVHITASGGTGDAGMVSDQVQTELGIINIIAQLPTYSGSAVISTDFNQ